MVWRVLAILLLLPSTALAAPSIDTVSGTVSNGQSVTVTGSGFGVKSPVAPVRYIDFETGINGQAVPNAEGTGGLFVESPGIVYDDSQQRFTGAQNLQQNFNSGRYNQTFGLENAADGTVLYMHGYFKLIPTGHSPRNAKFLNLALAYGGDMDDWESRVDAVNESCLTTPETILTLKPDCPQAAGTVEYETGGYAEIAGTDQEWHRIDSYLNLTVASRWVNIDNVQWAVATTDDMTTGCGDKTVGYVYFGYYYDNGSCSPTPEAQRWWDEVYIDDTQARVEICTGSAWASRGHCEIQIPYATWGNTSLQINVNQGTLADESTAYLYVIDAGGANSAGEAITIGAGEEDTTPATSTITSADPLNVSVSSATVTATCADETAVSGSKWAIGVNPDATHGTACTGIASASCSVTGLSSGNNDVRVACYDSSGNYDASPGTLTVNYTPPAVTASVVGGACSGCIIH